MSVRVRVEYSKLETFLEQTPIIMGQVFDEWQRQGAAESESALKANTPVRSGFLRNSVVKNMTPAGFTVYPAASYASVVEFGSKPHVIFPSRAKVLRFQVGGLGWAFGEGAVFAARVNHPGFPGRFFIRKTRDELREKLRDLYVMLWSRMFNEQ